MKDAAFDSNADCLILAKADDLEAICDYLQAHVDGDLDDWPEEPEGLDDAVVRVFMPSASARDLLEWFQTHMAGSTVPMDWNYLTPQQYAVWQDL
jgi:hypothetical protein